VNQFLIGPDRRKGAQVAPPKVEVGLRQKAGDWVAELAEARRQLQNEILRRRQAEEALEVRTAQLKATALELTQAEHNERQRLVGILHDGLQQLLVGAQLNIALLTKPLKREQLQGAVLEATRILDEAIAQTRSLAVELSPPALIEDGLVPALEWLGRWMHQKHGLKIRVTASDEALEASDEKTRLMLYNAVRELLFNVTKHAGVKAADVQIQRVGDQIQIVVADRGRGFDSPREGVSGASDAGLGLFRIRNRLDLLGGRFEIDSAPGKGSRFTLQAPVGRRASDSESSNS